MIGTPHAGIPTPSALLGPPAVVFEGYASVFDVWVQNTPPLVIHRGAFTRTLMDHWDRIRVVWYHDEGDPVGRPLELRQDEHGLFMRAVLSPTPRGIQAAHLLTDGLITELSIGFDAIGSYMDRSGTEPVQHVTEARLWEVSLCTHAANHHARITHVERRAVTEREQLDVMERTIAAHRYRHLQRHNRRLVSHRLTHECGVGKR